MTEYVTLVPQGGQPVRLGNQVGAPWPTTGTGSLVFADGATLTNATLTDAVYTGGGTLASLTVSGTSTLTGDVEMSSNATVNGTLSLNGALEITSDGETVTITAAQIAALVRPVVVTTAAIVSNTLTINLPDSASLVVVVMNNATLNSIVVNNIVSGQFTAFIIRFVSDGAQRTQPVFFNGFYSFPEGVPLTTSAVAGAVDTLTLVSWNGDENWEGFVSNANSVVVQ